MRSVIFWLAFPAIVIIACIFAYIGEREAEKKARYERGIAPAR